MKHTKKNVEAVLAALTELEFVAPVTRPLFLSVDVDGQRYFVDRKVVDGKTVYTLGAKMNSRSSSKNNSSGNNPLGLE